MPLKSYHVVNITANDFRYCHICTYFHQKNTSYFHQEQYREA